MKQHKPAYPMAALALATALCWGVGAWGKTVTGPVTSDIPSAPALEEGEAPVVPGMGEITPSQLLADQLYLLSQQLLQNSGQPRPSQLTAAGILLDLALAHHEKDVELWRFKMELARRQGKHDEELAAMRRYRELAPEDDAIVLDLIQRDLGEAQTLERRLGMLETLLDDPVHKDLPATVRSRLASTAAAAARETGQDAVYHKRLKQAITLDATNRQAMELLWQLVNDLGAGPAKQGAALVTMIQADPLNPKIRRMLADLLVEQGSYDQAGIQYAATQLLTGRPLDEDFYQAWVTCLIIGGQTQEAIGLLDSLEKTLTKRETAKEGEAAKAGVKLLPLPLSLELLRLVIFESRTEQARMQPTLERLFTALRPAMDLNLPQEPYLNTAERYWIKAAINEPIDRVQLETLRKDKGDEDAEIRRLLGWVALKEGDAAGAVKWLQPLAGADGWADLGLALAQEAREPETRVELLQRILRKIPTGMTAVLAARECKRLGTAMPVSKEGLEIAREMQRLSKMVREPDFQLQPWVQLKVVQTTTELQFLEPMVLKLQLRNMTDIPLVFAPEGVLPSRVLIHLQARLMGQPMAEPPALVVDVRRGMTLLPKEDRIIDVRLDRSVVGEALSVLPWARVNVTGIAVLDPKLSAQGNVMVGLLGSTEAVPAHDRVALPVSQNAIKFWMDGLKAERQVERMRAAAWLEMAVAKLSGYGGTKVWVDQLTRDLSIHYRKLDPVAQAWMLRFISDDEFGKPTLTLIQDEASKSSNALVRIVYLAARVRDPKSRALEVAMKDANPQVAAFARALFETVQTVPEVRGMLRRNTE